MSNHSTLVSIALAEEPVFDLLMKLESAISLGEWSLKTKHAKGKAKKASSDDVVLPTSSSDSIINQAWCGFLCMSKDGQPRWNYKVKVDILNEILSNNNYYVKWPEISQMTHRYFATEVVWQQLYMSSFCTSTFTPSAEYKKFWPYDNQYIASFVDWSKLLGTIQDLSNWMEQLRPSIMNADNSAVMMFSAKSPSSEDSGAMKIGVNVSGLSPKNMTFAKAVHALKTSCTATSKTSNERLKVIGIHSTEDEEGFTPFCRHFADFIEEVVVDTRTVEAEAVDDDDDGANKKTLIVRDIVHLVKGPTVKIKTYICDFVDWPSHLDINTFPPKLANKCSLMFADPSWGVNTDQTKYGGIDMASERWER